MTKTMKPLSRLAADTTADATTFKVAALEMLERAYRQTNEAKQPAVMVQAVRTAAEIGGILKGESASVSITIIISGDDKALL